MKLQSRHLIISARLILGAVFIYASIDKIVHPKLFAQAVFNYQILPDYFVNLTAILLPWLELIMGIFLVAGIWLPGAVPLANFLLLTFSGVLIFNLVRGLNVSCGCFSTEPSTDPISLWTVVRDVSFLLPSIYLLFAKQLDEQDTERQRCRKKADCYRSKV